MARPQPRRVVALCVVTRNCWLAQHFVAFFSNDEEAVSKSFVANETAVLLDCLRFVRSPVKALQANCFSLMIETPSAQQIPYLINILAAQMDDKSRPFARQFRIDQAARRVQQLFQIPATEQIVGQYSSRNERGIDGRLYTTMNHFCVQFDEVEKVAFSDIMDISQARGFSRDGRTTAVVRGS